MSTAINLKNLSKDYFVKNVKVSAVKGVSVSFEQAKISVIVGKSGCGKTTLLRLISGLEALSDGSIDAGNAEIGYVFQEPRLFPWLTVRDNICFAVKNIPTERIDNMIKLLGLYGFDNAYPAQISGGMAQRVALGRTLIYDPSVILMDEPFASLDYFTRKALQQDILRIHKETGKTIILVTHDLDEALALADDIYMMESGIIISKLSTQRPSDITEIESYKAQILNTI